ncbi:PilZ domain-containing protein [Acidobacteria bacterium AH-259-D05]|nr:PilZ domain-containing protein [Acidobacteria bacterium AH-259-D05]
MAKAVAAKAFLGRAKDRRRFTRYLVSIPCSVVWNEKVISGTICDLSLGGASITKVDSVPGPRALVDLLFQVENQQFRMKGKLVYRIINKTQELIKEKGAGALGIEFI